PVVPSSRCTAIHALVGRALLVCLCGTSWAALRHQRRKIRWQRLLVCLSQACQTHPQRLSWAISPGDVRALRGSGEIAWKLVTFSNTCSRCSSPGVCALDSAARYQARSSSCAELSGGAPAADQRAGCHLDTPAHLDLCLCREWEDDPPLSVGEQAGA